MRRLLAFTILTAPPVANGHYHMLLLDRTSVKVEGYPLKKGDG